MATHQKRKPPLGNRGVNSVNRATDTIGGTTNEKI